MDFVWLFPGPFDVPKLRDALARTLQDFYHGIWSSVTYL